MLDFSKIESGRFSLEVCDFHLETVFRDALKTLELRAQQAGSVAGLPHPADSAATTWPATLTA